MKQGLTILLALLIFLQPFSKVWIHISFKINQDKIAKTLCVKKEIENNTCQGKCHLKKQLEKADEEEQKQAPTNTKEKVEVLYSQNHSALFLFNPVTEEKSTTYYSFHLSEKHLHSVFHPPKV